MIRDNIGSPHEVCEVEGCLEFGIWWTEDGQHCYCDKHKQNQENDTKK